MLTIKRSAAPPILTLISALTAAGAAQAELSGYIGIQGRYFTDNAAFTNQADQQFSVNLEPEWYYRWNNGNDSVTVKPYLRLDSEDSERSHADIRELFWLHAEGNWELGAGISKVFWGVTETQHLVDVINQTDLVEAPDGEDKLGQPMIRYSYIADWGVVDAFLLPGFRPRTFPGKEGRLRTGLVIDTDNEQYESAAEEKHVDVALRWSHSIGLWDLGLSWFRGTDREPLLLFNPQATNELTPFYRQLNQFGLDAQMTIGSWLWKLEAIHKNFDSEDINLAISPNANDYSAATAGFEYTLVGIFDSAYDLGWLVEYSWDERDQYASSGQQNDLFTGGRLAFNDAGSTEILFGISQDLDFASSHLGFIEASTRIGESGKLYLESRYFSTNSNEDPLFQIRQDSYIELSYEYYF